MGFKTEYNEITLKEFCNLNCIMKEREVLLYDYNSSILNPCLLTKPGYTVDEIPDIFADWFVEYIDTNFHLDASGLGYTVYRLILREP